jgi:type I restriction enzyme R subunit
MKRPLLCLSDTDKHNLINYLAPLVYMEDTDEFAKRFDNFMYGLMLSLIEGSKREV